MIKNVWNFFQNEVLGMRWLNRGIGRCLEEIGFDTGNRIVGSIQFFLYDVVREAVER